jgi:ABC-type multidrug transport system fused ATPase/permease subunit
MDCDRLLVLSAGRLVEQGSPSQLAKSGGVFARLVTAARRSGVQAANS